MIKYIYLLLLQIYCVINVYAISDFINNDQLVQKSPNDCTIAIWNNSVDDVSIHVNAASDKIYKCYPYRPERQEYKKMTNSEDINILKNKVCVFFIRDCNECINTFHINGVESVEIELSKRIQQLHRHCWNVENKYDIVLYRADGSDILPYCDADIVLVIYSKLHKYLKCCLL